MQPHDENATKGLSAAELVDWFDRVLFKQHDPIVVALKGGWGEGKTYFWKKSIVAKRPTERFLYASVFGAQSVQEVRERLVADLVTQIVPKSVTKEGRDASGVGVADRVRRLLATVGGHLPDLGERVGLPGGLVTRVLEDQLLKPGTIVCLDDIERTSTGFPIDALLGFISELRDGRRLKVVLIFSDEKISERQGEVAEYREKVIDREVAFRPAAEEVIRLAFEQVPEIMQNDRLRSPLTHWCAALDLRNIRLLTKVRHYYEEARTALPPDVQADFIERILGALVLFVWVRFARRTSELPSFETLRSHSELYGLMRGLGDEERGEPSAEKSAGQLLSRYGYLFTDNLDRVLMDLVETDVLAAETLRREYEAHLNQTDQGRLEAGLRNVWKRLFHGTLQENEDEFCNELIRATRQYLPTIGMGQLDGTLSMLERMGRDHEARALLDEYRVLRSESLAPFDRGDLMEPIRYAPLDALLTAAEAAGSVDARGIDEVIRSALEGDLTSRRDRERLSQFSVDEFEAYFLSAEHEGLTSAIRELGNAANRIGNPDDLDRRVQERVRAAAVRIAGTSRINRLRMEAMGLVDQDS